MKFKKDQRSAKIPGDLGQVASLTWEPSNAKPDAFAVWLISPQEMAARIKDEPPAKPVINFASIVGDEIIVSPLPDVDGTLRMKYYPAIKEA